MTSVVSDRPYFMSDGFGPAAGNAYRDDVPRDRVAGHVEHRVTDERARMWRRPGGIKCLWRSAGRSRSARVCGSRWPVRRAGRGIDPGR